MQWKYVDTETSSSRAKSETHWHYILPKAKTNTVVSLGLVFGPLLLQGCLVVHELSKSTSEFLDLLIIYNEKCHMPCGLLRFLYCLTLFLDSSLKRATFLQLLKILLVLVSQRGIFIFSR